MTPVRSFCRAVVMLLIALVVWPSARTEGSSAYFVPLDLKQPGEFTVQIPWRLGPEARTCPLVVHGFFGYTYFFQEQIDLFVDAIDVEIDGHPYRPSGGEHTYSLTGDEARVRPARSGRMFWYRIFDLPAELFSKDRPTRVRVRIARRGDAVKPLVPVPNAYNTPPDMRIDWKESPFAGDAPGWYLFEVRRSSTPLPGLVGWVAGDTHVHTEYTHSSFEYGGPLESYTRAARAIGLDWATWTDHGHSLDSRENLEKFNAGSTYPPFGPRSATRIEDKWNELVERTATLNRTAPGGQRPFVGIVGTEVDVIAPSAQGLRYFCHALVYGHSKLIPAEGPNGIDVKVGPVTVRHGEHGFSGQQDPLGKDTLTLERLLTDLDSGRFGDLYGPENRQVWLAHPMNKYDHFVENRIHIGHWWRWGFDDDPDELPAFYAPAPGRLRVSGFQLFNSNTIPYGEELDPSLPYLDGVLCEGLRQRPVSRTALLGGTDTHGDLTSNSVRSSEPGLGAIKMFRKPDGDGFGTVRTLVPCPGPMSERSILQALKNGRTVVTNGPALLAGIDLNGDGRLTVGMDALPSTNPGDEATVRTDTSPVACVEWNSSEEFGAVEEVRLIVGRPTGPRVLWTGRPTAAEGMAGSALVNLDTADIPEWSYLRAQCVTRRGKDVTLGDRLQRRIERRAYTSPVWIRRVAP